MDENLEESTLQYLEDDFYKYVFDTKKIEKIPSKFTRNIQYTTAQIAVDCESVEFIDHQITIALDEDGKYESKNTFQILKLKNLLIKSFKEGENTNQNCIEENDYPTRLVSGKRFIILAFTPIFHGFTEFYSQFETLNDFDSEIKPFFIFDHHDHDYHKGIFDIYKKEFNLNNEDVFSNGNENVIIEEVYIIHDDNALISHEIDKKFNLVKLISGDKMSKMSEMARYYRAPRSLVQDYVDADRQFPFKLPGYEACLFGLSLMVERHKKYINKFDEKIDVLYISRENYSNKSNEDFKQMLEQETINPKDFISTCKTYFDRTILDENKFIDLLKTTFNKKEEQIKKVFFEELSYIEQISLIQNSNIIISLQGSGLCNAIFADKKTKIIEIAHPFDDEKFRIFFNPTRVNTPKKYLNYIKTGNWHTIIQADWKDLSVQILNNEEII